MVKNNLPHDRRDCPVLVSIMRQHQYYAQWDEQMRERPVPLPRLWGVPRASTERTLHSGAEGTGFAGVSGTDEPVRLAARVWSMAQHGAALVADLRHISPPFHPIETRNAPPIKSASGVVICMVYILTIHPIYIIS